MRSRRYSLSMLFLFILFITIFSCKEQKANNNDIPNNTQVEFPLETKYSARAIQEEALQVIGQLDNITEEQNKKILKILEDAGIFTLKTEQEYNKYKRLLKRRIRKEVLKKDQIEQYKKLFED